MRFAFLVHPLSSHSKVVADLDAGGLLRAGFGGDVLSYCHNIRKALSQRRASPTNHDPNQVKLLDEFSDLVSATGASADGRLYEIPMDVVQIFENPARAMTFMEQATDMAKAWGAQIVGLGSLTGVVGNQGAQLAERGPAAVTTGNSLTVYAALENLRHACVAAEVELSEQCVAVIGIPGSIASAAAALLRPLCRELLLVGRHDTPPASALAERLDAEFLLDIPAALRRAGVILSATSSGNCIAQAQLQPGTIVVDVGVPTDVEGAESLREDVLFISGGLARVPDTMPRSSMFLSLHQGVIPCCLGETIVLALENRRECFSIGRNLSTDRIQEIGDAARRHGFDFTGLLSFGLALETSTLMEFRKSVVRGRLARPSNGDGGNRLNDSPSARSSDIHALAAGADSRYREFINPVMIAVGERSGLTRTFVRGEGAELWDEQGNRYLDFVAGFGSLNLGHNHPRVKAAIVAALEQCAPGFAQSAVNPYTAKLAERLVTLAPRGLEMVFFCNSGTEAVEAALKLARAATGRQGLLSCRGSYHGKTIGALSVTGNGRYQRPFLPLLPGCKTVPYGDLKTLGRALRSEKMAAFLVEPIQGEGGMVVPPAGYLAGAERLCHETGTLLIVDEVQTGLGRTGTLFACDEENVCPDILALAKSLGGGLVPIGATLMRRDLWHKAYGSLQSFALHTSTFGGGSVACCAGLAALDTLEEEQLPRQARLRGEQLLSGLSKLVRECAVLREVRGRGLMIGLEFEPLPESLVAHWKHADQQSLLEYIAPDASRLVESLPALYVMQSLLLDHGIYTQVTRSNPNVLRVQPPLTISQEQVAYFLESIEQACTDISGTLTAAQTMISRSVLGIHEKEEQPAEVTKRSPKPKPLRTPTKKVVLNTTKAAVAATDSGEANASQSNGGKQRQNPGVLAVFAWEGRVAFDDSH
ncbi:MAG: aminotransferase class III-fold pyridoxal phosphate-dependent enzyme [Rhodopirellula sp.]|nr:aminotransferase class III-fold pyridoxal phosphate-dependent enzyme [Rhodopirellula sp.]